MAWSRIAGKPRFCGESRFASPRPSSLSWHPDPGILHWDAFHSRIFVARSSSVAIRISSEKVVSLGLRNHRLGLALRAVIIHHGAAGIRVVRVKHDSIRAILPTAPPELFAVRPASEYSLFADRVDDDEFRDEVAVFAASGVVPRRAVAADQPRPKFALTLSGRLEPHAGPADEPELRPHVYSSNSILPHELTEFGDVSRTAKPAPPTTMIGAPWGVM